MSILHKNITAKRFALNRTSTDREHAARLRQLGCDLSGTDFTATFQRQLDDLVAIQLETGLLAVTELNLQHWYQDRKLDVINGAQALAATRAHCLELEQRIAAVQRDAERVELLVREAQREFPASADAEREAVRLEREVQEKRHSLVSGHGAGSQFYFRDCSRIY